MISLVMTTYNGEKYILEQLKSIRYQSKQPNEVIIQDDASTDNTFALIMQFIEENKVENWKVYQNSANKGWKHNFYDAISKASGDIIFFADQDDVWHSDKISIMSGLFEAHNMDALYADMRVIDENGKVDKARMEKSIFSENVEKIFFSSNFYTVKTLGCCMCVSRRVADMYLELNCPECGHDSQCGRLALLCDGLWHFDSVVIDYRMHSSNTSGISNVASYGQSTLEKRREDLKNDLKWIGRILKDNNIETLKMLDENKKNIIKRSKDAMKIRYRYLSGKKGVSIFSLMRYLNCYSGIGMLLGDFAYKNGINKKVGLIRWKIRKNMGL